MVLSWLHGVAAVQNVIRSGYRKWEDEFFVDVSFCYVKAK